MWYPFYYSVPSWDRDTPKWFGVIYALLALVLYVPVCMVIHTIVWFPIAFIIGAITAESWWIGFAIFMLVVFAPILSMIKNKI